jgi:hypothetical protein
MVRDVNRFHHFNIVFFLAWTIDDASSLSCQSLSQLQFFHTMCSSNINCNG